jgi:release factor glutamine methyltransferase
MVIAAALKAACGVLREKETPRLDAELLLAFLTGKERLYFALHPNEALEAETVSGLLSLAARRASGEPIAYIVGEKEFMSLRFRTPPGVLIPRPDTETLVETILRMYKGGALALLELCVGSGAASVSVLKYLPQATAAGFDVSPLCAETARQNAARHGVGERARFFVGDLFEKPDFGGETFDCVAANPPYIPSAEIETLSADVKNYEPRTALDGGADGLDFYRFILSAYETLLKPNGKFIFEIGYNQAEALRVLARGREVEIIKDLAGNDRVCVVSPK